MKNIIIWARDYQPARATAVFAAAATVASLFGYGQLVADISIPANTTLGGIAAIIVLLSGERTRAKVWAPASINAIMPPHVGSGPAPAPTPDEVANILDDPEEGGDEFDDTIPPDED